MIDLWTSLITLILGSAIVPVQIIITILLLRSDSGRVTSAAFVVGMTLIRLVQGAVFGLTLSSGSTVDDAPDGPGLTVSVVSLLAGVLLLAHRGATTCH